MCINGPRGVFDLNPVKVTRKIYHDSHDSMSASLGGRDQHTGRFLVSSLHYSPGSFWPSCRTMKQCRDHVLGTNKLLLFIIYPVYGVLLKQEKIDGDEGALIHFAT